MSHEKELLRSLWVLMPLYYTPVKQSQGPPAAAGDSPPAPGFIWGFPKIGDPNIVP